MEATKWWILYELKFELLSMTQVEGDFHEAGEPRMDVLVNPADEELTGRFA